MRVEPGMKLERNIVATACGELSVRKEQGKGLGNSFLRATMRSGVQISRIPTGRDNSEFTSNNRHPKRILL